MPHVGIAVLPAPAHLDQTTAITACGVELGSAGHAELITGDGDRTAGGPIASADRAADSHLSRINRYCMAGLHRGTKAHSGCALADQVDLSRTIGTTQIGLHADGTLLAGTAEGE